MILKSRFHNRDTHIEALYVFIGENLSEERFFPEPLSKDF